MNPQEAQQAQTIAEIRKRNDQRGAWIEDCRLSDEGAEQACYDCNDLIEIVDSQAQKIAEARNEAKYWRDRAVGTLHPRDRGKVNTLPWVDGP